jgi:hypothetical protein
MTMKKLLEAVNKFAGEPKQKRGDHARGTDMPKKGKGFINKLVGEAGKIVKVDKDDDEEIIDGDVAVDNNNDVDEPDSENFMRELHEMSEDMLYMVVVKGGSIGSKKGNTDSKGRSIVSKSMSREEAKDKAKRMNKQLSPGEKEYYRMRYSAVPMESVKSLEESLAEEFKNFNETTDSKFYVSGFPNKRGKFRITDIQEEGDRVYNISMGKNGVTYDEKYHEGKIDSSKLRFRDGTGKPVSATSIYHAMNGNIKEASYAKERLAAHHSSDGNNWSEDNMHYLQNGILDFDIVPDDYYLKALSYNTEKNRYSAIMKPHEAGTKPSYVELNFNLDFGGGGPYPTKVRPGKMYASEYLGGFNDHEEFIAEGRLANLALAGILATGSYGGPGATSVDDPMWDNMDSTVHTERATSNDNVSEKIISWVGPNAKGEYRIRYINDRHLPDKAIDMREIVTTRSPVAIKRKNDVKLKEAPIEPNADDAMDPMIHGTDANPAKLKFRMSRATRQLLDLSMRAQQATASDWQDIAKRFAELKMNINEIDHALKELAKLRKKGGVKSRGIDDDLRTDEAANQESNKDEMKRLKKELGNLKSQYRQAKQSNYRDKMQSIQHEINRTQYELRQLKGEIEKREEQDMYEFVKPSNKPVVPTASTGGGAAEAEPIPSEADAQAAEAEAEDDAEVDAAEVDAAVNDAVNKALPDEVENAVAAKAAQLKK